MRGHEALIALRRRGTKPGCCWLTDHDAQHMHSDWQTVADGTPWVLIEPTDNLDRLDLRFLVGLQVFVAIDKPDRMRAVVDACGRAGASRAVGIATSEDGGSGADSLVMADTSGVY